MSSICAAIQPQNASARGRNRRQAVHVRHRSAERNVVRGANHLRDNYRVLMQHSPPEIKDKLLKALDSEYNVVDMDAVLEIITILEKTPITKEALESTRLGKHINEFRRKTNNESLAKRAKDLVRRWRDMIMPTSSSTPPSEPATLVTTSTGSALNGSSCSLPGPGPGGTKLCRSALTSPAMSTASSSSPGLSVRKGLSLPPSPTPRLPPSRVAHTPNIEAVARTHANNKRLRKDDASPNKDGSPPAKRRSIINGIYNKNHENDSAHSASSLVPTVVENVAKNVKNDSLSCGSATMHSSQTLVSNENDIVKAKMAQIGRSAKVKTTRELLDDLKARGGSPPSSGPEPSSRHRALNFLLARSPDEVSRNKTEHMAKFLSSQAEEHMQGKQSFSPSPLGSPTSRDVRDILAQLPPLDLNAIVWSDQEEDEEQQPTDMDSLEPNSSAAIEKAVPPELLEAVLAGEHVETVTGNTECCVDRTETTGDGDSDNRTQFKEWHEPVWRESYDEQKLLVWPYVITD
ncbi:hypothetical protein B566_EDAN001604 [Ephemera danica]|nr:hypothetical protein B566_EDAN001604 [Ephemera danica]